MNTEEKMVFEVMYHKYRRMLISKKEMAQESGVSCSTLDRLRRMGIGVSYIKQDAGNVMYPLTEVAKYIISAQTKTL